MKWKVSKNWPGHDSQGLVIDEESGKNVAVTYDNKDATLVAAAPEMVTLLRQAEAGLRYAVKRHDPAAAFSTAETIKAFLRGIK